MSSAIDETIERIAVSLRQRRFDAAVDLTRAISAFLQLRPPADVRPGPRISAHLERARLVVRDAESRYVVATRAALPYESVRTSSPSSREVTS